MTRGNARRAKGPCCRHGVVKNGRGRSRLIMPLGSLQDAATSPVPDGEGCVAWSRWRWTSSSSGGCAVGHITRQESARKRSAGNPPAPFEVAGAGNGPMVRLLRHSQRKRRAPARSHLLVPRLPSTLPRPMVLQISRGVGAEVSETRDLRRDATWGWENRSGVVSAAWRGVGGRARAVGSRACLVAVLGVSPCVRSSR